MSPCPYPEPGWEEYPTAVCMTFDCLGGWWATAYWEELPIYDVALDIFAMGEHFIYIGGEKCGGEFDNFYVEPFMIEKEAA